MADANSSKKADLTRGKAILIGVLAVVGAVVTWNKDLGPHWYPLALIVTALPCAWVGGKLRLMQMRAGRP